MSQPLPRRGHAAVSVGRKLYVWGGHNRSTKIRTATIESFDVSSETWLKSQQLHGSQLPNGLWDMAVTSDGEIAYTFGGRTGSYPDCTYYNTLYQINLSTMKCTELVPRSGSNPPMKACGSRMIYFSGKLVVYGGYTGRDWTDQLRVFDLRKGEFEW